MLSLGHIRQTAAKFCSDRSWEQFHKPTSIALALAGECGELCEIFQWKHTLDAEMRVGNVTCLSSREVEHIGEEIADVFIYSARLADLVGVDMAECVLNMSAEVTLPFTSTVLSANEPWMDCGFEALETRLQSSLRKYRSQRQISLQLQSHVGKLCQLFATYQESNNAFGLKSWSKDDIIQLKVALGMIGLTLVSCAMMSNLKVGEVIARKFEKNAIKYPVDLSRRSSAKYTVYDTKLKAAEGDRTQIHVVLIAVAVFAIGSSIQGYISR